MAVRLSPLATPYSLFATPYSPGGERSDRRKSRDIRPGEPACIHPIDAAEGEHGERCQRREAPERLGAETFRVRMAGRCKDRRHERDIGADRARPLEFLSRMAGRRDDEAPALAGPGGEIARAQMEARRADRAGEIGVSADQQDEAARRGDVGERPRRRRPARIIVIAQDHRRPGRQRAGDGERIDAAPAVAQKREVKRRADRPAGSIESHGGGC